MSEMSEVGKNKLFITCTVKYSSVKCHITHFTMLMLYVALESGVDPSSNGNGFTSDVAGFL